MKDAFGRDIDYLRLSVTDRCNLRCVYCLPVRAPAFLPAASMLSDSEITELVRCLALSGISKIRITGGEPLVRPGLPGLVAELGAVPGVRELSLSTNGVLLADHAAELKKAGLRRVNVSLDSLDAERFSRITRFGELKAVLAGIEAALRGGLAPVKINVVVARGFNEDEVSAFAELTVASPLHVRFIELMPMGAAEFFDRSRWVGQAEIMERAGPLEALSQDQGPEGHGPARYFRRPGARGTIGFISPLSCGFCSACNRLRLTAGGTLVPCLDGEDGADLRTPLRESAGRARLLELIAETIRKKPEAHQMVERAAAPGGAARVMCQIGG